MEARPITCPECGELIIALPGDSTPTLVVPVHPDRVTPFVDCVASARAMLDGKMLLP